MVKLLSGTACVRAARVGPLAGLSHRQRIAALLVDERRPLEMLEHEHLADEDLMITAFVAVCGTAFEARRATVEQRDTAMAARNVETGELVGAALREQVGQRLLVGGEHVHGEVLGRHECRQARRALGEAPQHERRFQ